MYKVRKIINVNEDGERSTISCTVGIRKCLLINVKRMLELEKSSFFHSKQYRLAQAKVISKC